MPEWTDPDGTDTGSDSDTEPVTEPDTAGDVSQTVPAETESTEPEETTGQAVIVWKYSAFLKGTIVLTGAVLGLCAFLLIAIPDWTRDEKKKE